jgi:hypothetical protein
MTPAFTSRVVRSIAGQSFRWIHFDAPILEKTRQAERRHLLELARRDLVSGFDWLTFLLPWADQTLYFSGAGHIAATQLIDEILQTLQDRVKTEALELFATEGAHLQFYPAKATRLLDFASSIPTAHFGRTPAGPNSLVS